jgi:hypothetical protein
MSSWLTKLLEWESAAWRERVASVEAALRRYLVDRMMTLDEFKDAGLVLEEDAPPPAGLCEHWRIKDRDGRVVLEGEYRQVSLLPGVEA